MKRWFASRFLESMWHCMSALALIFAFAEYLDGGWRTMTYLLAGWCALMVAMYCRLRRQFDELLATNRRVLGELQGALDRVAVREAVRVERGDE